jgi:hypothetical protein
MGGPSWVGQEHPHGCGVAAVAMVLGVSYGEALSKFAMPDHYDLNSRGLIESALEAVLAENGFAFAKVMRHRGYLKGEPRAVWPVAPWADVHLAQVTHSPGAHFIVVLRDGTVLDPATPQRRHLTDWPEVYWIAAVCRVPNAVLFLPSGEPCT